MVNKKPICLTRFHLIMNLSKGKHPKPLVTRRERNLKDSVRIMTQNKDRTKIGNKDRKRKLRRNLKLKYHLPYKKVINPQGLDIFSYCCCHCTTPSIEKINKSKNRPKSKDIKRKRIKVRLGSVLARLVTQNVFKKTKTKTAVNKKI